ncbi:MAG: hypothetical protein QM704_05915 [Anaeromyxobacteraceae bacterium]
MRTRIVALTLLAVAGCGDLTLPWSDPPTLAERGRPAGQMRLSTDAVAYRGYVGVQPSVPYVVVGVVGADEPLGVYATYDGAAVSSLWASPLSATSIELGFTAVTPQVPGTLESVIVVHVCADEGCVRELENSPMSVRITVEGVQPELVPSKEAIGFTYQHGGTGASPVEDGFTVREAALGLPYEATLGVTYEGARAGWLSYSHTPAGDAFQCSVQEYEARTLPPGVYRADVEVRALGTELRVPVALTVTEPAVSSISPASVSFSAFRGGSLPAEQSVTLQAAGVAVPRSVLTSIEYPPGEVAWLWAAGAAYPGTVTLGMNSTDVPGGAHAATVRLRSEFGTDLGTIAARLDVAEVPYAAVPAGLAFSISSVWPTRPASQTVAIDSPNAPRFPFEAAVTVDYAAGPSGWLDTSGTALVPGHVGVGVWVTGLAPGTYHATVLVKRASDGHTLVAIPVTLTVKPPALVATPPSLTFRTYQNEAELPPAQTVTLTSAIGEPVAYTVSWSAGWLPYAHPPGATTPGTVEVQPYANYYNPGIQEAEILVPLARPRAAAARPGRLRGPARPAPRPSGGGDSVHGGAGLDRRRPRSPGDPGGRRCPLHVHRPRPALGLPDADVRRHRAGHHPRAAPPEGEPPGPERRVRRRG